MHSSHHPCSHPLNWWFYLSSSCCTFIHPSIAQEASSAAYCIISMVKPPRLQCDVLTRLPFFRFSFWYSSLSILASLVQNVHTHILQTLTYFGSSPPARGPSRSFQKSSSRQIWSPWYPTSWRGVWHPIRLRDPPLRFGSRLIWKEDLCSCRHQSCPSDGQTMLESTHASNYARVLINNHLVTFL